MVVYSVRKQFSCPEFALNSIIAVSSERKAVLSGVIFGSQETNFTHPCAPRRVDQMA